MTDFWTIGPTAASMALGARGFSPREAEKLVRLRMRYARGEFRELSPAQRRQAYLLFLRWLFRHGKIDNGNAPPPDGGERSAA
jgi:hypothetical protein